MYQLTDGTFEQARHYCIKNHQVHSEGAWDDWDSCWFNGLYMRVVPSHAEQARERARAEHERAYGAYVERRGEIEELLDERRTQAHSLGGARKLARQTGGSGTALSASFGVASQAEPTIRVGSQDIPLSSVTTVGEPR